VGAAMEGYLFGIPAIAFSQTQKGWSHLDAAARKARELVQQVIARGLPREEPWLLNVNIPNLPYDELKPFKVCRLGRRHAAEKVISQPSPHGEMMYWIGGAGPAKDGAEGTDFHATAQGHVSITPLKVDLTDHDGLATWANAMGAARGAGRTER
jgi:5'-nucleotidase